jgi:hypothetical protein
MEARLTCTRHGSLNLPLSPKARRSSNSLRFEFRSQRLAACCEISATSVPTSTLGNVLAFSFVHFVLVRRAVGNHPNIIELHGWFVKEDQFCTVMDFISKDMDKAADDVDALEEVPKLLLFLQVGMLLQCLSAVI